MPRRDEQNDPPRKEPEGVRQNRFPLPWSVKAYPSGFVVLAANGNEYARFEAVANRDAFPEGRTLEEAMADAEGCIRMRDLIEQQRIARAAEQGGQTQRRETRSDPRPLNNGSVQGRTRAGHGSGKAPYQGDERSSIQR